MCSCLFVSMPITTDYTVTRIDGKLHQPHRVAQTKQSGWWEIISTFAMDIFGFFRHFRCKLSTISKCSDYILFSKDGNFRLFCNFPINFLLKRWKFPTCRNFLILFPFQRVEFPNIWDGHIRFFPKALRKLNSTDRDRSSVLWLTSQVLYRCATLLLEKRVIKNRYTIFLGL